MRQPVTLFLVLILPVFFISCKASGGDLTAEEWARTCAPTCGSIPPDLSSGNITPEDIQQGRYYGEIDQKKQGTPDDWIHTGRGTRSATWTSQTADNQGSCDCILRM